MCRKRHYGTTDEESFQNAVFVPAAPIGMRNGGLYTVLGRTREEYE